MCFGVGVARGVVYSRSQMTRPQVLRGHVVDNPIKFEDGQAKEREVCQQY